LVTESNTGGIIVIPVRNRREVVEEKRIISVRGVVRKKKERERKRERERKILDIVLIRDW
jgi:hypothetical protein